MELQVDACATSDEADAYMHSQPFGTNPIGVEYDPDEVLAQLRAGTPESEVLQTKRRSAGLADSRDARRLIAWLVRAGFGVESGPRGREDQGDGLAVCRLIRSQGDEDGPETTALRHGMIGCTGKHQQYDLQCGAPEHSTRAGTRNLDADRLFGIL